MPESSEKKERTQQSCWCEHVAFISSSRVNNNLSLTSLLPLFVFSSLFSLRSSKNSYRAFFWQTFQTRVACRYDSSKKKAFHVVFFSKSSISFHSITHSGIIAKMFVFWKHYFPFSKVVKIHNKIDCKNRLQLSIWREFLDDTIVLWRNKKSKSLLWLFTNKKKSFSYILSPVCCSHRSLRSIRIVFFFSFDGIKPHFSIFALVWKLRAHAHTTHINLPDWNSIADYDSDVNFRPYL